MTKLPTEAALLVGCFCTFVAIYAVQMVYFDVTDDTSGGAWTKIKDLESFSS